jgi:hypothetical protein
MISIQSKKKFVPFCALVIVSVCAVDVNAVNGAFAGADVAVVHVDGTAGAGVGILAPAIAPAESC